MRAKGRSAIPLSRFGGISADTEAVPSYWFFPIDSTAVSSSWATTHESAGPASTMIGRGPHP